MPAESGKFPAWLRYADFLSVSGRTLNEITLPGSDRV